MNGPQHYRESERLLPIAHDLADQGQQVRADFIVARAQVHATLALVAATVADQGCGCGLFEKHDTLCPARDWQRAMR